MPVRRLSSNPNLDHLKYQAKDLLKEHKARTPGAAQRIREFHPRYGRASDAEIFSAHEVERCAPHHRSRVWIPQLGTIENAH